MSFVDSIPVVARVLHDIGKDERHPPYDRIAARWRWPVWGAAGLRYTRTIRLAAWTRLLSASMSPLETAEEPVQEATRIDLRSLGLTAIAILR